MDLTKVIAGPTVGATLARYGAEVTLVRPVEPPGPGAFGWGPFHHCYQAADGWLSFAASKEGRGALATVADLRDLAELPEAELFDPLSARFKSCGFAHWQAAFAGGSSAVVRLASLLETRDAALQVESEGNIDIRKATFRVIRHDRHPMGRWCDLVAPNAVRPRSAKITIPGPMAKYGQHTKEVLASLGYDPAEIDAMIESGAAGLGWSKKVPARVRRGSHAARWSGSQVGICLGRGLRGHPWRWKNEVPQADLEADFDSYNAST